MACPCCGPPSCVVPSGLVLSVVFGNASWLPSRYEAFTDGVKTEDISPDPGDVYGSRYQNQSVTGGPITLDGVAVHAYGGWLANYPGTYEYLYNTASFDANAVVRGQECIVYGHVSTTWTRDVDDGNGGRIGVDGVRAYSLVSRWESTLSGGALGPTNVVSVWGYKLLDSFSLVYGVFGPVPEITASLLP